MLLVLMYHRVNNMSTGASPLLFREHLDYLSNHFPIVNLGDPITDDCIHIALTFDDGFFDFYHNAWPILEELKIPATLGIPTKFIQDDCDLVPSTRLSVKYPQEFNENVYSKQVPFCTWKELKEITKSDIINIASHSVTHPHLTAPGVDLSNEIIYSKSTLEEKLDTKVSSFFYPFGNMNRKIHNIVKQHYDYIFRIGSSLNKDWAHKNKLFYRVDAENFWKKNLLIEPEHIKKYRLKYFLNRIRGK